MATNTNAAAYLRLKPLEGTNVGSIIEEHVRYWNKMENDRAAQERARQAKEQELRMKMNKESFELYDGLMPDEVKGFLASQIIDNFEKRKPYLRELSKRAAAGDNTARLELSNIKSSLGQLANASNVYSAKMNELQKQKGAGNYNEYLDGEVNRFMDSMSRGKFKVNEDFSLDVYSPAIEEAFRGQVGDMESDGMIRLGAGSLLSNDFLNASFHKSADFRGNGAKIADNLLDSQDGNKTKTPQTRTDGVKLVKGLFGQDPVEANSFYAYAQRNNMTDFQEPLENLLLPQLNTLAEMYYDQFVDPQIQEVDNSALNESRRLQNQRTRQLIRQGDREEQEGASRISLSTDEEGNALVMSSIETEKGVEPTEISTVFNLGGSPVTVGVQGKSGTNRTFNSIARTQNGKIYAVGEEVSKQQVPLYNEDGSVQVDGNGNEKFRTEETVVPYIEENPTILNNIARQLPNDQGRRFNNLNELRTYLDRLQGNNTQQTTSPQTGETREERLARLRQAATGNN